MFKTPAILLGLLGVAFFIWLIFLTGFLSSTSPISEIGAFGDSFGIATSIFAGISVFLLFKTLKSQEKELKETRDQIRYQQLENSLFQMFNSFDEIVSAIDMNVAKYRIDGNSLVNVGNPQIKGRSSFKAVSEIFKIRYEHTYDEIEIKVNAYNDKNAVKRFINDDGTFNYMVPISHIYDLMWPELRAGYSHYFRYLYRVLKVIDNADLSDDDKVRLSRIIRAQLSDYELLIIFYNCISQYGENLVDYVKRYEILDNLSADVCIKKEHYYLVKQFKKNDKKAA